MDLQSKLDDFAAQVRACPHNLLSKGDLEQIETRHFPECLEIARRIPDCGKIADLGSGGGFPGIVIAIARPDLEVHLIEATRKKSEFLFDVAERLELRVLVHNARAEDLGRDALKGAFPIVTARAVARLPLLLTWAMPLVSPGGEFWAIKGDQWSKEVREARHELRRLHVSVLETPNMRPKTEESMARVVRISNSARPKKR